MFSCPCVVFIKKPGLVARIASKTLGLQLSRGSYKEMAKESWSHQDLRACYPKIQVEEVAKYS